MTELLDAKFDLGVTFYREIEAAERPQELFRLAQRELERIGTLRFVYLFFPPESLFDSSHVEIHEFGYDNLPEIPRIIENFVRDKSRVPLITLRAFDFKTPYTSVDRDHEDDLLYQITSQIGDLGKQTDLADAVMMPVYGPRARLGLFCIAPQDYACDEPIEMRCFQALCQAVHQRYCEIWKRSAAASIDLSARETEVLRWVVMGKSNSVIADILGISAHTIDSTIRRLFLKLNVNDRISAVVKAIEFDLLVARLEDRQ